MHANRNRYTVWHRLGSLAVLLIPALGLSTCSDGSLTGMWIQIICPDIDIDQARLDVFDPEAVSSGPLQTGWVPASPLAIARNFTGTSSDPENQLWVLILVDPREPPTTLVEGAGLRDEREVAFGEPALVTFDKGRIIEHDGYVELTHQGEDEDGDGFYVPEDCDDDDKTINPEAQELCDGLDNNCNGTNDEGCACPPGETRPCWPSWEDPIACPPDAGCGCAEGTQTCEGGLWSTCVGIDFRDTEGGEACQNGSYDCYPACFDGIDNDCDGDIDDADSDCVSCLPNGSWCSSDDECCSNNCSGWWIFTRCR